MTLQLKPQVEVIDGDCLNVMTAWENDKSRGLYDVVITDPPFNTMKDQVGPNRALRFADSYNDYHEWLMKRLTAAWECLAPTGSMYVHLDQREVHRVKVLMDIHFGQDSFLNEIIWSYDYGARQKNKWATKHDNILVYVKDPSQYYFDLEASDRIPYMSPGLVGPEKTARGKIPTDVWWMSILHTASPLRTGYPTQKPPELYKRMLLVSCPPGGRVLDPFAGAGTTGLAAADLGLNATLIDSNQQAIEIMRGFFPQ